MVKCHKISWISALFVGVSLFVSPGILADGIPLSKESRFVKCQTALEKFSLRLEERSRGRPHQTYYANLYRQTQDFITSLKNFPTPSTDKCQNFLNVVQGIVGSHGVDLEPMPRYSDRRGGGRPTKSLKMIPKRELRNVRYEYGERGKPTKEKKEMGEEEEDLEELNFTSSPIRRSSRAGNHFGSENRDNEPKF